MCVTLHHVEQGTVWKEQWVTHCNFFSLVRLNPYSSRWAQHRTLDSETLAGALTVIIKNKNHTHICDFNVHSELRPTE